MHNFYWYESKFLCPIAKNYTNYGTKIFDRLIVSRNTNEPKLLLQRSNNL